mgnify:FL=1
MNKKTEKLMIELYQNGVLKFGKFILKSGIESPFYIDLRILISYPKVLKKVAQVYDQMLKKLEFDRMVAVPYTGIPIVCAISLLNNRPFLYTRKEVKSYGIKRPVEGEYQKKDKVVLIDDMITTGGSKLEVIKIINDLGLQIKDVVVLFDRLQGGKEELAKEGFFLHSAFTILDWINVLKREKIIGEKKI